MEVSAVPVSPKGGTLSLLRAAAEELAAEESQAGLDGLLVAADEIANERGLMSPLRYASPTERGFEEYSTTANAAANGTAVRGSSGGVDVDTERDREAERETERCSRSERDSEREAEALLRRMSLSPSPATVPLSLAATTAAAPAPLCTSSPPGMRSRGLAQTVDLRARRSILKNNKNNDNGNSIENNVNNNNNNNNNTNSNRIARTRALSARETEKERERRERETQRYLHLLSHNARTQLAQSARSSLSHTHTHSQSVSLSVSLSATTAATTRSLSARRSALSQRLMCTERDTDTLTHTETETERAEAKPVRESLFRSDAEEKLFRSMHTVSVSSHTHSRTHRDRDRDSKEDEKKRESAERDSKDTGSERQREKEKDKEKEKDRERERRRAIERLSRPAVKSPTPAQRRSDPLLRFLTFEEARESTFRPSKHTHRKKGDRNADAKNGRDDDNRTKEDANFAFVRRQEAELRARRRFQQGQADYDARLDKKHCPRCGAAQSYDEVREKRKQCPHCRVNYAPRKTWNSSSAKLFFAACTRHAKDAQRRKEELLREVEKELKTFTVQRVDPHTGKVVSVRVDKSQDVVLTREEEEDFLLRLDEYRAQREARLKELEKSVYEESCPFRPTLHRSLSASNKHKDDSDFSDVDEDGEGEANPVQAFLRRYEEDLQQRMQTMLHRFKHRSKRREDKKGSATESEGEGEDDLEQDGNRHSPKPFRFGLTI